jgi:hypothetical protein
VKVDSWEALMWKRSEATRPATPSDERWKIARKYTATAVIHTA